MLAVSAKCASATSLTTPSKPTSFKSLLATRRAPAATTAVVAVEGVVVGVGVVEVVDEAEAEVVAAAAAAGFSDTTNFELMQSAKRQNSPVFQIHCAIQS